MNIFSKKKSRIYISITILFLFCILYFWIQQPNEGKIIENNNLEISNNQLNIATKIEETSIECFSFKHSNNITNIKEEISPENCVIRATLKEPIGQITISITDKRNNPRILSMNDFTGVTLRENNQDIYTKILEIKSLPIFNYNNNINDIETAIFQTPAEITGFFFNKNSVQLLTVSIHSVAKINDEIMTIFWNLISDIEVK